MSLLKRLMGDPAPSQEDLQRQADEEIKQMMSQSSGPPADMPVGPANGEMKERSEEPAAG